MICNPLTLLDSKRLGLAQIAKVLLKRTIVVSPVNSVAFLSAKYPVEKPSNMKKLKSCYGRKKLGPCRALEAKWADHLRPSLN